MTCCRVGEVPSCQPIRKYKNGTIIRKKEAKISTKTATFSSTENRTRIHKLRMTTSKKEVTSTPDLPLKIMRPRSITVARMMMKMRILGTSWLNASRKRNKPNCYPSCPEKNPWKVPLSNWLLRWMTSWTELITTWLRWRKMNLIWLNATPKGKNK